MKIIAKQVPPEHQISPLIEFDAIPKEVFVFGNRNYIDHTSDVFNNIPYLLDELSEELDFMREGRKQYTDFSVILEAFTGKHDYTRAERLQWIEILDRWENSDEENALFCDVLKLLTGDEYASATIKGCCQGDWQHVIYPAKYGREWLNTFETEYFNLGTEWRIYEGDSEEYDYDLYCTTDDPRKEIAEIANTTPDNVILYAFAGWEYTPKYEEVQP